MPAAKKTYTVHAHIYDRKSGRTHSSWTKTGLTKAQANKLAAEQRREEGGYATVVDDSDHPLYFRHPRKSTGRRRSKGRRASTGRRVSTGSKRYKRLRKALRTINKRRSSGGRRR